MELVSLPPWLATLFQHAGDHATVSDIMWAAWEAEAVTGPVARRLGLDVPDAELRPQLLPAGRAACVSTPSC